MLKISERGRNPLRDCRSPHLPHSLLGLLRDVSVPELLSKSITYNMATSNTGIWVAVANAACTSGGMRIDVLRKGFHHCSITGYVIVVDGHIASITNSSQWLVPGRRRYHAGYPRQQAWPQHGFHGTPYQAPNNQAPGHQYPLQNWTYAPPPPGTPHSCSISHSWLTSCQVYSHDAPPNYQPPDGPPPGHDTKGGSGPAVTTMPVAGESATHHRS